MTTASRFPNNDTWTLWFYDYEMDKDWDDTKMKKIHTIDSIESFWSVISLFESMFTDGNAFHLGMFFFMKGDIYPTWEDPRNMNGGSWSYKISFVYLYDVWIDLCIHLMCGTFVSKATALSATSPENIINGISISPKRGFSTLKVWISDIRYRDPTILNPDLKKLDHTTARYKKHMAPDV